MNSSVVVSDTDIETFSTDGVVCLRGVIGSDWIDRLRTGVEHTLAHPTPRGRLWNRDDFGRESRYDSQVWTTRPEYSEFVFNSPLAEIAGRLMRSSTVNFFFDAMFVRTPGTRFRTPFHQDEPFWSIEGFQTVSSWMPLVPVARESCLEVVRGSHRWPEKYRQTNFGALTGDERDQVAFDQDLAPLPDIEANRDDYDLASWDMEPGDVICFNGRCVHGGSGNLPEGSELRVFNTKWGRRRRPRPVQGVGDGPRPHRGDDLGRTCRRRPAGYPPLPRGVAIQHESAATGVTTRQSAPPGDDPGYNWSENLRYTANELVRPGSIEELQELVAGSPRVKALGARHCFTPIADSPAGVMVSLENLPTGVEVDTGAMTATVSAGLSYGEAACELSARGVALANMATLPHITMAGGTATGTHGSGDSNQVLAAEIAGLEVLTADGNLRWVDRNDPHLGALALGLGAFGIITRLRFDVEPTYDMRAGRVRRFTVERGARSFRRTDVRRLQRQRARPLFEGFPRCDHPQGSNRPGPSSGRTVLRRNPRSTPRR